MNKDERIQGGLLLRPSSHCRIQCGAASIHFSAQTFAYHCGRTNCTLIFLHDPSLKSGPRSQSLFFILLYVFPRGEEQCFCLRRAIASKLIFLFDHTLAIFESGNWVLHVTFFFEKKRTGSNVDVLRSYGMIILECFKDVSLWKDQTKQQSLCIFQRSRQNMLCNEKGYYSQVATGMLKPIQSQAGNEQLVSGSIGIHPGTHAYPRTAYSSGDCAQRAQCHKFWWRRSNRGLPGCSGLLENGQITEDTNRTGPAIT